MATEYTERVSVPVTPELKELWSYWAGKKGVTVPTFVRECVGFCINAYRRKEDGNKQHILCFALLYWSDYIYSLSRSLFFSKEISLKLQA